MHRIYGLIFNLCRIFPLKKNRVAFITTRNASFESNLKYVSEELKNYRTSDGKEYESVFVPKDVFSISNIRKLACSRYVFLTDNFFALAFMRFNSKTKLIQLWHGTGVFKKFGYELLNEDEKKVMLKFSNKITNLFVSSKNVIDIYARNFAIDKSKVIPLGIPRNDYYSKEHLDKDYVRSLKAEFEKVYPNIKGKKIVLYAPTFREVPKYNNVFAYFDIERFIDELGDEYILCIKLHPNYKKFCDSDNQIDLEELAEKYNIVNFTQFKDEQQLFLISDILITDYSSVMVEYTLLNKPIILFAYDLDNYLNNERGFYFDYKKHVPGTIVQNTDELLEAIKNKDFNMENLHVFANYQFDYFDEYSSKRILDYVLED
ncbi:CDP-glycerol glycerophosphotransferase family protein [uncultured Methanobrevibacter sp.]|uniref:CDP-glycerol glycerophosphotransferase family protein n=1 Tax=uncultured Methanobrevibacter sp. TaxID=253161 RepID=UPI0026398656